jgi:hypothetical protein
VRLAQGDRAEAQQLLRRALPLARWSATALHLLQRVYGTMIRAAPDVETARAVVDQAMSTVGQEDACPFCSIMLAVPAAIACADAGDLARIHRFVWCDGVVLSVSRCYRLRHGVAAGLAASVFHIRVVVPVETGWWSGGHCGWWVADTSDQLGPGGLPGPVSR